MNVEGKLIEKVSGSSLVKHLRPGEPAPFKLATEKSDVSQVANVIWDIKVQENKQLKKYSREIALLDYWDLPYGEQAGRPEAFFYPYEKLTGFKVVPSFKGELKNVELTIAWISPDCKVQWIEKKMDDLPGVSKKAGAEGYFEQINVDDPDIGPDLYTNYEYIMWGVGEK